mmetsp:Transcript_31253/g.49909  ORF Transcript_31253/g.49909 Transcript_31253/m.49909 type:complete len:299 (-) Transcript_31253:673-1569(-)
MPMISFAALSFANVSTFSACSVFLSSVASATCLSSALIPSSSASISEANVAMLSLRSSIAFPRSDTVSSNSFKSSSVLSMVFSQYSFFSSSAVCSLPSSTTMSSIIFKTLSKLTFLPLSASAMRFTRKSPFSPRPACCKATNARFFTDCPFAANCNRAGVGSVFLNNSSASSSLSSLIVSAIASNSSARTLVLTAHSSSLVLQFFSKSFRKASSSIRLLVVSSRSSFWVTSCTPSSPMRVILLSIDFVKELISLVFAAINSSKSLIADVSSAVAVARLFSIVSVISLRIPTICPLWGT